MSQILQTDTDSRKLCENFLILIKICFILIIIYVGKLEVTSSGIKGLWLRLKKFKIRTELVNKYPGSRMYPLLGSIPGMSHLVYKPCRDLFPWIKHMAKRNGPIFRLWIFIQPKLFITCPDTAIACLKEDKFSARSSEALKFGRKFGADGLIYLASDVHGQRRKMWNQWFTRKHINGNLEMFQNEALRLSQTLSMKTTKTFDILDYSLHCTFRIVACSAFGQEYVNGISEAAAKQHFTGLSNLSINQFTRSFRPWLRSDFIYYNFTVEGRQTMRCVQTAHNLTLNAIKQGKMLRANKIRQMDTTANVPCFLDHLLDIHEHGDLTEKEIFMELNSFLVAGYDTTGLSICWTLYLLALHPEYQTKIVDELFEIFDGNIKDISYRVTPTHLQNMRFLELCIKESLRMYPAFAMLLRSTGNDEVECDGKIVPSEVDVHIPLRAIHQDPKYFPEPDKFIPERHLVPIPAYIPFGMGSRNCVGQVHAMQGMKIILTYLLMEYKWETPEKPDMEPLMVPMSYPENGIRFNISKRSHI